MNLSNSNTFATGDPMSRIAETFPLVIRMQTQAYQAQAQR